MGLAVVRALSSHRFNSGTWYHMWVEFVVGSCPCSTGLSTGFLKTSIEIRFDLESVDKKSHLMECSPIPIMKSYLIIVEKADLAVGKMYLQRQKVNVPTTILNSWTVGGNIAYLQQIDCHLAFNRCDL